MQISAERKTVEELLREAGLYSVPLFQRSYSWGDAEIDDFLKDILNATHSHSSHFIGSMVFAGTDGNRTRLIDGQQRFATIILFLCALRHALKSSSIDTKELRIRAIDELIYSQDVVTLSKNIKLELNRDDKVFFEKIVTEDIVSSPTVSSHILIKKAYEYFLNSIAAEVTSPDGENFVKELIETLLRKVLFIKINVDNESNAFILFETLNDRGLDLSVADLVKNYLFSIAEEARLDTVVYLWKQLSDQIDDYDITRFLRHLWSSKYKLTRKEDLYDAIKGAITRDNLEKTMQELYEEAIIYDNLRNPTHEVWNDTQIENILNSINLLNVEQVYVLLLGAYNKFYESEKSKFIKIAASLLNLTFRYNTVCSLNPNEIEQKFSRFSIDLRNGALDFDHLYNNIKSLQPTETVFKESFKQFSIKNSRLARYVLITINDKLLKAASKNELDTNTSTVNLEHIIPKKLNDEWEKFFIAEGVNSEDLKYKLGNLTILLAEYNRKSSNYFFNKKLIMYNKSILPINDPIKTLKRFGETELIKRQEVLADLAEKIWKVN